MRKSSQGLGRNARSDSGSVEPPGCVPFDLLDSTPLSRLSNHACSIRSKTVHNHCITVIALFQGEQARKAKESASISSWETDADVVPESLRAHFPVAFGMQLHCP